MSGYFNYSMSNNAVEAYENGKMPRSKWSKSALLDNLETEKDYTKEQIDILRKYPLSVLKDYFLEYSEWHHTSNYFNCTDFYEVSDISFSEIDFEYLDKLKKENIEESKMQKQEKKEIAQQKPVKAYCTWGEWEGTRAHPHLKEKNGYCLIKGNTAYTQDFDKKKISGIHFKVVKEYDKAPKGTAETFKKIDKFFKLSKKCK